MAIRWNTILHRYEVTSQVWNYQLQKWELASVDKPAEIVGAISLSSSQTLQFGQLSSNLSLGVSVNSGSYVGMTLSAATTQQNTSPDQLASQLKQRGGPWRDWAVPSASWCAVIE